MFTKVSPWSDTGTAAETKTTWTETRRSSDCESCPCYNPAISSMQMCSCNEDSRSSSGVQPMWLSRLYFLVKWWWQCGHGNILLRRRRMRSLLSPGIACSALSFPIKTAMWQITLSCVTNSGGFLCYVCDTMCHSLHNMNMHMLRKHRTNQSMWTIETEWLQPSMTSLSRIFTSLSVVCLAVMNVDIPPSTRQLVRSAIISPEGVLKLCQEWARTVSKNVENKGCNSSKCIIRLDKYL